MGTMRICDPIHGDETLDWDPKKPKEVEKAKRRFEEAVKKGMRAFKIVEKKVKAQGDQIKEFDPALGELLLVPPMAGG